jgi:hypothetical protein
MTDQHLVAVAYYLREEWEALRALAPDPDVLEDTYDEWFAFYTESIAGFRAAGVQPKRVDVRLSEFLDWCRLKRRRPDGAARAAYTLDVLARASKDGVVLPDA